MPGRTRDPDGRPAPPVLDAVPAFKLPERDGAPKKVRLLGEDLVALRDTQDQVGLMAANCPHRGASLFFGRNEECGVPFAL